MAVIVSEPTKELVGGGQNAKYIKECTELFLSGKGIEKLRNFEPFVNLESLWINGNKLKKLNNLDAQKRLKWLYAHDNQICTLKGSLLNFKFLEKLDLSNNQLRDLDKQLRVLEKFKFLTELNLKGNPLCEEPDYRLIVIHRMPALKLLDQHAITPLERRKAAGAIGGDVATLTVAFGRRVPPYDPAWDEKVPERSVLEQAMSKEASSIRDTLRHEAYMRERGMFLHDPHPEPPRGTSLPPNAGTVRAMQVWRQQQEAQQQQQQQQLQQGAGNGGDGDGAAAASSRGGGVDQTRAHGGVMESRSGAQTSSPGETAAGGRHLSGGRSGGGHGSGRGGGGSGRGSPADGLSQSRGGSAGSRDGADKYVPRDNLVLYSLRPGHDPLAGSGTLAAAGAAGTGTAAMATPFNKPPQGTIRFEQAEYERFLRQRAAGTPGWQLDKTVLQL